MTTNNSSYSTWPIRKSKSCPSVHGTLRHEPQPYVSYNPIHSSEIEKLLSIESELPDNWNKIKKTKDGEVWRRNSTNPNTPPITKTIVNLEGIPFDSAVRYLTDLELRRKWDKTYSVIDVLEKHGQFQVLYCSCVMPSLCKNREMILASIERRDHDQRRHIQTMCSILHPSVPVVQPNNIRAEVFTSGMIIRGIDDGEDASEVTIITQIDLRGTAPQFVRNSYLAENALDQIRMLKRYYKKHHAEVAMKIEKDRKVSEASYNTSDSGSPDKYRYKTSRSVDDIME